MSHAVRLEPRTTCPAADAGLMMPLTWSVMIFTGSPRLVHMVCTPSRLHVVSEPGRLSSDPRGVRHGVNFRAGEPGDRGGQLLWQHPGRIHPRPVAAAEQLGQLGGLLQTGRVRAAYA